MGHFYSPVAHPHPHCQVDQKGALCPVRQLCVFLNYQKGPFQPLVRWGIVFVNFSLFPLSVSARRHFLSSAYFGLEAIKWPVGSRAHGPCSGAINLQGDCHVSIIRSDFLSAIGQSTHLCSRAQIRCNPACRQASVIGNANH